MSSLAEMQILVRVNGKLQNEPVETGEGNKIITKLNLDVTAMMAFVSNLTCESCDLVFKQSILSDQACRERRNSTKLLLNKLFQGRRIIIQQEIKTNIQMMFSSNINRKGANSM